ncbi:TonB-dependent receptor [Aquimarina sp. I32.4]|uniref:TonB-dependent receptor n=1 Tax=Aquimarina sp. I32.4 TaxID=2053903 RepID=UPI000CDF0363|nr:TonB-dependent receptor [Aquimarina sp. I32.4]
MNHKTYSTFFIFYFIFFYCHCQNSITGTVLTENGVPIQNASVYLENTNIGSSTNKEGTYHISNVPVGDYTLNASLIGYSIQKKKISISNTPLVIPFILSQEQNELNEVVVSSKSSSQKLKETAYKPEVVSLQKMQITSTSTIDIVGQLSGVRIRKQGGVGSESTIMLNGISGKGIRTFVDGIPIDLLGSGFSLNNISSNIIKQVEVYKGLVPVKFGTDALGGVINIETQNRYKNYIDAFYTIGSWNTHQAGIGIKRYLDKNKKQFFQVDGFFNHSDNDYWMHDVDIVVDELLNTEKGKAKRFNDKYTSFLGRAQYGFQNVSWADDFRVILSLSDITKEWQHGIRAVSPWGEVHGGNRDFNSIISWKKRYNNNLKISGLLGYNLLKWEIIDIAPKNYFWDGTYTDKPTKGESGFDIEGRTPKINTESFFGRINVNYKLNDNHSVDFTNLTSYREIKGHDKAGAATYKEDFYTNPQNFTKSFFGLSVESKAFNKKLTNIFSLKYHYMKSHIANLKEDNTFTNYIDNQYNLLGYGDVLKFSFSPNISTHLGYEYTLRLPDSDELFGDGITVSPNPNLNPEKSHNINLGLEYKALQNKLIIATTGFYRDTKDQMFLNAVTRGVSIYDNLLHTEAKGVEGTITAIPIKNLTLFFNATWQDITLKDTDKYGNIEARHIGSKIPNIPYLFANTGTTYNIPNVGIDNSRIELSYNNNYVHEFFLAWEEDGIAASKAKIPTQFIHNASIGYVFPNDKYSINLECRNFTDQLAYDNYLVQKPGRSFFLKLRMYIN